jgi:beta-glucosidase-like glycosyl hydrolase
MDTFIREVGEERINEAVKRILTVKFKLGVFEGACTYIKGAYRPSEESMMNSNTEGFNAPSRKAIYDKIMERSLGKQMSYEEFAVFDLQNKSQTRSAKPTVGPSHSRVLTL